VVLGHDDALVINAGLDLDVDAAVFPREGMVVHGHLDGREFGRALDAGLYSMSYANVDVLSDGRGSEDTGSGEKKWQDQSHRPKTIR